MVMSDNEYKPDCWVMLCITNKDEKIYKILAGWSGSYLYGQSWKLNSGCVGVKQDGDYFMFEGSSGSVYTCHKDTYRCNSIMSSVLNRFDKEIQNIPDLTFNVMSEKTNFLSLKY
jgi:hypothetical protein